jgi:hypothetical protein
MTKPTIEDQIATLESTIDALQQRWKPFFRVQPASIHSFPNPLQYDPTRLIQKQEIALQIDEAHIELARRKAQQARETLGSMRDAITQAETEEQETRTAREAADQAYRDADPAWRNAGGELDRIREAQRNYEQTAASQERAAQRWADERVRDQTILDDAEAVQQRQAVYRANRDRERAA